MLEDGSRELDKQSYGERCCLAQGAGAGAGAGAGGGAGGVPDGRACCACARGRRASPLTCLAVCFLVLTYNLLGGFLFLALEGPGPEETAVAASMPNLSRAQGGPDLRSRTVERLWSITEDLNILYKENWTKLAAKELMDFQKVLMKTIRGGAALESRPSLERAGDHRWTFSTSFLYALTLITTIGPGGVAPQSAAGKALAVAYACVGIPLVMLYLSTLGGALARTFRALYSRLRGPRACAPHARGDCLARYSPVGAECKQLDGEKSGPEPPRRTPFQAALNLHTLAGAGRCTGPPARVPAALSALVAGAYVALGALLFRATERWSLAEGCYFSFSSLATIGFGDLRPGLHARSVSARAEDLAVGACCLYILVGIAVVAMCFNLVREDSGAALRCVAALCGPHSRAVHSAGGAGGAGGVATLALVS